uniref:G-protein coupled receptors family 1 profile domain-containing protein n=1 Tax=Panagrolaimus sp. JU765 TaxID=591449 RepID=A0AC34RS93_9BILA
MDFGTISLNLSADAMIPQIPNGLENPEQVSLAFAIGMAFGYIFYGVAVVFGIPCNAFVLFRMYKFAKQFGEVFSNGIGICLFTMAIADIVSLASICVHYVLSFGLIEVNVGSHGVICKIVLFLTHVSTSVSIWSWLLMSLLRYLSVYYPMVYIQLWKLPVRILAITLGGAFVTNIWLLIAVTYIPTEVAYSGSCDQLPLFESQPDLNRIFLFVEIIWSFCIPTAAIVFVDSSVYLCRYSLIKQTRKLEKELRKSTSPQIKKNRKTLWKWLVIALIDIGLNLPEQINRMAVILGLVPGNDELTEFYLLMRVFAQLLYYLQFSFNGVYLALFIYDKSTNPNISNRSFKSANRNQNVEQIPLAGRSPESRHLHNSFISCSSDDDRPKLKNSPSSLQQKKPVKAVQSLGVY